MGESGGEVPGIDRLADESAMVTVSAQDGRRAKHERFVTCSPSTFGGRDLGRW